MKNNKNLNVPCTIIHSVDNVQYRIKAELIGLNESNETCTIKFANKRVQDNIPLNVVYINENFLDSIKAFGKKAANWLVKKVKGLIAYVSEDGSMNEDSFANLPNLVVNSEAGRFPDGVVMYVCDNTKSQLEQIGVNVKDSHSIENFGIDSVEDEIQTINTYWKRVMKRTSLNDESIEESIKYVNETYYRSAFSKQKSVNEAVASLGNLTDGYNRKSKYSKEADRRTLVRMISRNIKLQLKYYLRKAGKSAQTSTGTFTPPLLIWGAPGIGKTSVVIQTLKKMNKDLGINLNFQHIMCNGINEDTFILPSKGESVDLSPSKDFNNGVKIRDNFFEASRLNWLPIYSPGDAEHNAIMESRFANCSFLTADGSPMLDENGQEYTGGIIFLDEIVRSRASGIQALMAIVRREIQGKKLADSWAIIAAANRDIDAAGQEGVDYIQNDDAIKDSFTHVTFVPTKEEWLDWAEGLDKDYPGMKKVEPEIIDFLKYANDSVWYRTVENGGFDDLIVTALDRYGKGDMNDDLKSVEQVREYIADHGGLTTELLTALEEMDEDSPLKNAESWTGRKWEYISNYFRQAKIALFNEDTVDDPQYTYVNMMKDVAENGGKYISNTMLETAREHLLPGEWEQWVDDYVPFDLIDTVDKRKISDIFNRLLVSIVAEQVGSDSEDLVINRELNKYFDWKNIFTEEVVQNIFENGDVPKDIKDEDDKNVGWKTNKELQNLVFSFIYQSYTTAKEDYSDYLSAVSPMISALRNKLTASYISATTAKLTDETKAKEVENIIKTNYQFTSTGYNKKILTNFFTVKTGKANMGNIVILDVDAIEEESVLMANVLYDLVRNNKFFRTCMNIVKYIIKVGIVAKDRTKVEEYSNNKSNRSIFLDEINQFFDINKELQDRYNAIRNDIAQILQLKNSTNAPYIVNLRSIDLFNIVAKCCDNVKNAANKEEGMRR